MSGNTGSNMNILGIITARGGSVRVPFKNIRPLAGKPLIYYMISAARKSRYLQRVMVSTDDERIRSISIKYGAEAPFIRPKKISGNCASVLVTQHAVKFVEKQKKEKIDIAVTLQPTSPFCTGEHIDKCIDLLLKYKDVGSVFSAERIKQHPEWMFDMENEKRVKPFMKGPIRGRRAVRQGLKKLIVPNGAVYVTRRYVLFEEATLISGKAMAYVMSRKDSIDIDHEIDLEFADFLLRRKKYKI